MKFVVYLRTNLVNGKQYVGQTSRFANRNSKWKKLNELYSSKILYEDRIKYGLENFKCDILAVCDSQEDAWELEKKYIKEYNTKYPNGYNMSDGGAGVPNVFVSEETRKKLSETLSGLKRNDETKQKISNGLKNNPKISQKVYQYTLEGELVKVWDSTKECGRNG